MSTRRQPTLATIHRLEDIPAFSNEAEEHAFWATHELSDGLWDQAEPLAEDELPPPRPATEPVTIRFDAQTLERIKVLARKRHKGYHTLIEEFVTERLNAEEERDGRPGATQRETEARQT